GEGPCRVAAQFVRLAFVALAGEDGDGRGGVVGAGGGGEAAVAGGGGDGAALQDLRDGVGVDLVVEAVAQQGVGHAGVEDDLLGGRVVGGEDEVGVGPAEDAGVGEQRDVRGAGGLDDVAVLGLPAARFAGGDEQHAVARTEDGPQRP